MRKMNKLAVFALAAAVMMAMTACGSKNTAETTAAAGETTEMETTTAPESSAKETTEETTEEETDGEDTEETEESAEKAELTPEVGSLSTDGTFTVGNGSYTITPPAGWSADGESDGEYVTFYSENGDDMLELVSVTGDEAGSLLEDYPETAEEYKNLVSRGDGMEIVSYDVESGDDGSQTFKYSARYTGAGDGIRYMAVSGAYDAASKTYISAVGTIYSEEEGVTDKVEAAVSSLKINK